MSPGQLTDGEVSWSAVKDLVGLRPKKRTTLVDLIEPN